MTAYATTLLKQPHNENYGAMDSIVLATLGSLEARLVKSPNGLTNTTRPIGAKQINTPNYDWFIVVSEKNRSNDIVAICPMTMKMRDHSNKSLEATSLNERFEVEGSQDATVFLTIAPFEFVRKDKIHRAQGVLWQAITHFCMLQDVDYVIGSLAFNSRYPAAHALELSYLYHFCRPHSGLQLRVSHGVTMDIMPQEAIKRDEAFFALPPMLRYFLRIGAKVGENAIVDRINNETRVFLLFSVKTING